MANKTYTFEVVKLVKGQVVVDQTFVYSSDLSEEKVGFAVADLLDINPSQLRLVKVTDWQKTEFKVETVSGSKFVNLNGILWKCMYSNRNTYVLVRAFDSGVLKGIIYNSDTGKTEIWFDRNAKDYSGSKMRNCVL